MPGWSGRGVSAGRVYFRDRDFKGKLEWELKCPLVCLFGKCIGTVHTMPVHAPRKPGTETPMVFILLECSMPCWGRNTLHRYPFPAFFPITQVTQFKD